jgi:hypothetical protein|tara:strand:- start:320 stop:484 length:165 start_codon:yes stop_codon:yes gene_type:complete
MKLSATERAVFVQLMKAKIEQGSVFVIGDGKTTTDVDLIISNIEEGKPLMEVAP